MVENGELGKTVCGRVQVLRRRGISNWGVFGGKDLQGGGVLIGIGVHALYGKLVIVPGEHWLMLQKDARRDLRVCRDGQGGGDQVDLSIAARVSRRRGNFPDRHPVQRSQA